MPRAPIFILGLAVGLAVVLGACAPIGQRTFVADADKPPRTTAVGAAAPAPPSPALVLIRFPSGEDWRGTVDAAVGLARARKPDVLFTVESAVPRRGTPAAQADALSRASADAGAVANAIVADGADRAQVELTAATDPAASGEEVRIYVR